MLEQQDFEFAGEIPGSTPVFNRYAEYLRLLGIFSKLYFQARLLIIQNFMLSCRLQLCELPLTYLKVEIFIVRLSLGIPIGQCWPAEKSASIKRI
jgi:hypothetical protein